MSSGNHLRHFFQRFIIAVILCFICTAFFAESASELRKPRGSSELLIEVQRWKPSPITLGVKEMVVARSAVHLAFRMHFTHPEMSPQLSSRWFNEYFSILDYNRIYFTEADIESFRASEGMMYSRQSGVNVHLATQVYELMLKRMKEYVLYSCSVIDSPFDFSVPESMAVYKKAQDRPWCRNHQELEKRWYQQAKNFMLAETLRQERLQKKASASINSDAAASPKKKADPKERYKKRLLNAFLQRADIDTFHILEYFINALTGLLDPHSNYFAPESEEDFDIQMSAKLQGIGATLSSRDGYVTIVSIVNGSPAARSGKLHVGDKITAVGQSADEEPVDVVDMPLNKVVQKIRGKKGTAVYLTVVSSGASTEQVVRIVRDEIQIEDAKAQGWLLRVHRQDGGDYHFLHVYLPAFYLDFSDPRHGNRTSSDIQKIMDYAETKLREQHPGAAIDGVILDMRGNGGGSLEEAIRLGGMFMGGAPVVQVCDSNGNRERRNASRPEKVYRGPLVVMVDHFSASATEIVAAALQDSGRALIVGDSKTHGKGSVQSMLDLRRAPDMRVWLRSFYPPGVDPFSDSAKNVVGSLKLTIAKFYRINGGSTQWKGVVPDIVFPSFAQYMGTCEQDLPNALPWDEIRPMSYRRFGLTSQRIGELRGFAELYQRQNPAFLRYTKAVDEYRLWQEKKSISLQRDIRAKEIKEDRDLSKKMLSFQPDRSSDEDEKELLKEDDDEEDLEDDGDNGVGASERRTEAVKATASLTGIDAIIPEFSIRIGQNREAYGKSLSPNRKRSSGKGQKRQTEDVVLDATISIFAKMIHSGK